jgi:hypothetical protein
MLWKEQAMARRCETDVRRRGYRLIGFAVQLTLMLFGGALVLSACAAPSSYMGISLTTGAAASDLQALALRAQSGDKQAQLDLGVAYEEGRGVGVDLKRAEKLYRMAATTTGGTIYVYQPPVKPGAVGMMVQMDIGPVVHGLEAAQARLYDSKLKLR